MREQSPAPQSFASVLRRARLAAGLTQEELAARATISPRAISDLERGVKTRPQRETVRLLVEGLGLAGADQETFEGAARPRTVRDASPVSVAPASPAPVPSVLVTPALPATLPAPTTTLVGRADVVAAIGALLREAETRLVTITGPGGVGKTRLALALGATLAPAFAGDVVFVPLATVREPAFVPAAVALALGLAEERDVPPREVVLDALRERDLLLVLDNLEQIIAAAEFVAAILAACPRVKILVTSRVPLRVRGEREYALPPLAVPEPGQGTIEAVATPAVELFVERARRVEPTFALTAANAATVAAICRGLDGLPLAIELAAPRIRALSPDGMLGRLTHRLRLLTGGPRDAPARHQTMRTAIGWSYDLLSPDAQALFRRLSVFAGGCTLDTVEAVGDAAGDLEMDALDGIEELLAQSLLRRVDGADGAARFGMLETIREYAAERLDMSTDAGPVRERFAAHYLTLAEAAKETLVGPQQGEWLARLETEHDNLREMLRRAMEAGAFERALRACAALEPFWRLRGYLSEGHAWLTEALARGENAPGAARAAVLNALGNLAYHRGDYASARAYYDQCLTTAHTAGDTEDEAVCLGNLGLLARSQGDYAVAREYYERSLAAFRALGKEWHGALTLGRLGNVARSQGDYAAARAYQEQSLAAFRTLENKEGIATALSNLGNVAHSQGDYAASRDYHMQSLAVFREIGGKGGTATALTNLANIAYGQGDYAGAQRFYEQSLAAFRELGDKRSCALTLGNLGDMVRRQGDYALARRYLEESTILCRDLGAREGIAYQLEYWASLSMDQGQDTRAGRLLAATDTLRQQIGALRSPADQETTDDQIAEASARVGATAWGAAWAEGAAMTADEAIAYALVG